MTYTVKQLSKLSGVSVRTLHWYDEIGLLKPAFQGANNYRYYEEAELLRLQQILFFRELGFCLNDISKLLLQSDFDNADALKSHRKILEEEITRQQKLLLTIDKTILHLAGKSKLNDEELYHGFDLSRQKEYEAYLVDYYGTPAEDLLFESKRRTAKWDKDEWDKVKNEGDAIHKALAVAIDKGLAPDAEEVQIIICRHYQMINRFYDASKVVYVGLTNLYADHPDFRRFFDVYHPRMIEFLSKAIKIYADKNL